MTRVDRQFTDVIYLTLEKITILYSSNDVVNNTVDMNKLANTVSFLEDLLIPYADDNHPVKKYAPKQTGDLNIDLHYRIRELIKIAKAVALSPPKKYTGDASGFERPILEDGL